MVSGDVLYLARRLVVGSRVASPKTEDANVYGGLRMFTLKWLGNVWNKLYIHIYIYIYNLGPLGLRYAGFAPKFFAIWAFGTLGFVPRCR